MAAADSHIETWLNHTIAGTTSYNPMELMFGASRPDLFAKLLPPSPGTPPPEETTEEKALRAYARMRKRAEQRKERRKGGTVKWEPKLQDAILVRCQSQLDMQKVITGKFRQPYDGPWYIIRVIPPSIYEVSDSRGRVRGTFNKTAMKPFLTPS
jgi:hypothetical protein